MPVPAAGRTMRDQTTAAALPFMQVVAQAEALGTGQGLLAVIALDTDWIAAHHHDPNLFAAWFNLGTELSRAGATAEASGAYRNALRHKPDFHGAAINL